MALPTTSFKRCFISAPSGLDLGALPRILTERTISWEWAKEGVEYLPSPLDAIRTSDFIISIFNGSRSDYRVFYETGIAVGLSKSIFVIIGGRLLPFDLNQLHTAKVPLNDRSALSLHLDLFLQKPKTEIREVRPPQSTHLAVPDDTVRRGVSPRPSGSELEKRVYDIVEACGGRAISEPANIQGPSYRPDLLAWLGNQDSELLDPTVIEIKSHVMANQAMKLEEKLLSFMVSTGIKTGFILTEKSPPKTRQHLSPYIYWLSVDEFDALTKQYRLGSYVRETRNRMVHGAS